MDNRTQRTTRKESSAASDGYKGHDMKVSDASRKELGPIAAKYVENLQRSNEQLVKLAALLQKQKHNQVGLSADDKEQLFDLLNEDKEDG